MFSDRFNMRSLWAAAPALLAFWIGGQDALANEAGNLRVTDYFITYTSNEPFYTQYDLDPQVTLRVREVVLAGRERTAARDGKVLLLIQGFSVPGHVAFDTDYENCSLMRHFARLGWDTFTVDFEGFGASTRPLVMDDPAAFPDAKAPIRVDVTLHNVERVVDFIRALRGVEQVHLLGWSQGAVLEAPRYAIRHPDKVASLILKGGAYENPLSEEERDEIVAQLETEKVLHSVPLLDRWAGLGTEEDMVVRGCFEAYLPPFLASDPKSGELGGVLRVPAGRSIDVRLAAPHFDAGKITVPTMVIRGEADTWATHEDNQQLLGDLASDIKEYVEIPGGGHFLHFEHVNLEFYRALQAFLEAQG
jgi:pimeloyl-ACP methyl ester carboxylesterase